MSTAASTGQEDDGRVADLQEKLTKLRKENQDQKYEYLKKCKELEAREKSLRESETLVTELKAYAGGSSPSGSNEATVKTLREEVARLKNLNKNRDVILADLEDRSATLRETETQLKLQ
jgi:TolA-binding protein